MKRILISILVGITLTLSSQTIFKDSYLLGQTIVDSYRFADEGGGDFTPEDLGSKLIEWYKDASDNANVEIVNTDEINTWYSAVSGGVDLVTPGGNPTQASDGAWPNGINVYMRRTGTLSMPINIFMRVRYNRTVSQNLDNLVATEVSNTGLSLQYNTSPVGVRAKNSYASSSGRDSRVIESTDTTINVRGLLSNSSSVSEIWVNNSNTSNTGTQPTHNSSYSRLDFFLIIGGQWTRNVYIKEIVITDGTLTQDEIDNMDSYLNTL